MKESNKKKSESAAAREERLAVALRENLKKRKEQIQARAALFEAQKNDNPVTDKNETPPQRTQRCL